jgi:hypothetical protein
MDNNIKSSDDIIKIVVFGPGYGESIIINIPGVGWGVIDSCLKKVHNENVNPALKYLKENQVSSIAFLILSHPHEDHYAGLDQIIDEYIGHIDRICFYNGDGMREYREYLIRKDILESPGLRAFSRLFKKIEEAQKKGTQLIRIAERTEILSRKISEGNSVAIFGLSPSAESVETYKQLLFEAIPKNEGDVFNSLTDKQHNLISAAIWVSAGNIRLILGSDVEIGDDDRTGWKGIVSNIDCPDLSVRFIKVSHHGSSNAFFKPAWEKHCKETKPIAVITPYNRLADPLPRKNDIEIIAQHTDVIYITNNVKYQKQKKVYDPIVVKNTRGVANWKCLIDDPHIGIVEVGLSMQTGDITECQIIEPAYKYEVGVGNS